MSDDSEFDHVTTDAAVEIYKSSQPIFVGLLKEVRELSRKKSEATMSPSKVKIINRVLTDLLSLLKDEPAGKYLETLDDAALPQVSDAVLAMVQFETALKSFADRYLKVIGGKAYWITAEQLAEWDAADEEHEEDEDDEDDEDEDEDDEVDGDDEDDEDERS